MKDNCASTQALSGLSPRRFSVLLQCGMEIREGVVESKKRFHWGQNEAEQQMLAFFLEATFIILYFIQNSQFDLHSPVSE